MRLFAPIAALALGGCSFAMATVPSGWEPDDGPPKCSTSRTAPTMDLLGALGTGLAGLATYAVATSPVDPGPDADQMAGGGSEFDAGAALLTAVVFGIPAALFVVSAEKGFSASERCQRALSGDVGLSPNTVVLPKRPHRIEPDPTRCAGLRDELSRAGEPAARGQALARLDQAGCNFE